MRKGFTITEFLIILSIGAVIFGLIIGAVNLANRDREKMAVSPDSKRLEIVDGPLWVRRDEIFIIKDKKTEREFVYINGYSPAVCALGDGLEPNLLTEQK